MNIAVTGGLGTGKSTVGKMFASSLGCEYLDTDRICRNLMEPGSQGFCQFTDQFGHRFLGPDGSVDRIRLRQAVFTDSSVKEELEHILHPLVRQEVARKCQIVDELSGDVVVEVPLLFEVGWQEVFDVTVVVYIPEQLCIRRVSSRDGLSVSEIKHILDAQLPIEAKRDRAHFVIDNSGTFASTTLQLRWVLKKLKRG